MPLPRAIRSFRLRPGRPVGTRLRQWIGSLQEHGSALDSERDPIEAVHQLRLTAKALRAVLRLADEGKPGPDLMRRDAAIRRLASLLGTTRDDQVQSLLLEKLVRDGGDGLRESVARLIRRWTQRRRASIRFPQVQKGLVAEAAALADVLPSRVDAAGIRRALRRVLRKTLSWREQAVEGGIPEDFHAWRRWQKRLESQLRLVGHDPERDGRRLLKDLHALQEDLGALHDADALEERLGGVAQWRGIEEVHRKEVLRLLRQRQKALRRRLVKSSRKVLGSRLRRFCRETTRAWEQAAKRT